MNDVCLDLLVVDCCNNVGHLSDCNSMIRLQESGWSFNLCVTCSIIIIIMFLVVREITLNLLHVWSVFFLSEYYIFICICNTDIKT